MKANLAFLFEVQEQSRNVLCMRLMSTLHSTQLQYQFDKLIICQTIKILITKNSQDGQINS